MSESLNERITIVSRASRGCQGASTTTTNTIATTITGDEDDDDDGEEDSEDNGDHYDNRVDGKLDYSSCETSFRGGGQQLRRKVHDDTHRLQDGIPEKRRRLLSSCSDWRPRNSSVEDILPSSTTTTTQQSVGSSGSEVIGAGDDDAGELPGSTGESTRVDQPKHSPWRDTTRGTRGGSRRGDVGEYAATSSSSNGGGEVGVHSRTNKPKEKKKKKKINPQAIYMINGRKFINSTLYSS